MFSLRLKESRKYICFMKRTKNRKILIKKIKKKET